VRTSATSTSVSCLQTARTSDEHQHRVCPCILYAEQLRTIPARSGKRRHATVVLDMTGTRFCHSEGFSVLVAVHKWALAEGAGCS
jgi:hypothetical protein